MGKAYFSNASWSKVEDTQDCHDFHESADKNFNQANVICEMLMNNWGPNSTPCEIRGTCIKAWVTDENGSKANEDE